MASKDCGTPALSARPERLDRLSMEGLVVSTLLPLRKRTLTPLEALQQVSVLAASLQYDLLILTAGGRRPG